MEIMMTVIWWRLTAVAETWLPYCNADSSERTVVTEANHRHAGGHNRRAREAQWPQLVASDWSSAGNRERVHWHSGECKGTTWWAARSTQWGLLLLLLAVSLDLTLPSSTNWLCCFSLLPAPTTSGPTWGNPNITIFINVKNCSLYTLLTATDRKPPKS